VTYQQKSPACYASVPNLALKAQAAEGVISANQSGFPLRVKSRKPFDHSTVRLSRVQRQLSYPGTPTPSENVTPQLPKERPSRRCRLMFVRVCAHSNLRRLPSLKKHQFRRVGKGALRAVPTRTANGGHASLCPPYNLSVNLPRLRRRGADAPRLFCRQLYGLGPRLPSCLC
jgi:hypothetical protein